MNKKIYETLWRNKYLTLNAKSIDDMIEAFKSAIEELTLMKEDGLEGEFDGAGDDYIYFKTSDSKLAVKHEMHEIEIEDDLEEE